jgi:DNA mismatch endonuclease Vsr
MQAVKSKGTLMEVAFAKALWSKGYRFRKNVNDIFGKPDIAIKKYKIAIFLDSEFWHGKNWKRKKHEHKSNIEFWHRKIERNIQRDKEVNRELRKQGWIIKRFWEKQIKNDLETCIIITEEFINENKKKK